MPSTRVRNRHVVTTTSAVAVMAILGVTLTACGASDEPDEGTTSSSSPSGQPTASSADPYAGWHKASDDGGQFLVPPDWSVAEVETGHDLQAPPESENGRRVGAGIFTSRPTLDSDTAIDDSAKSGVSYFKGGGYDKVERRPDESFGGVTFYHVRAEDPETWLDSYGTVVDGQKVTVLWNFNRSMVDRKESDDLINQVMPTFQPAS